MTPRANDINQSLKQKKPAGRGNIHFGRFQHTEIGELGDSRKLIRRRIAGNVSTEGNATLTDGSAPADVAFTYNTNKNQSLDNTEESRISHISSPIFRESSISNMDGAEQDIKSEKSDECRRFSKHAARISAAKFGNLKHNSTHTRWKSLEYLDTATVRGRVGISSHRSVGSFSEVEGENAVVVTNIPSMSENKPFSLDRNSPISRCDYSSQQAQGSDIDPCDFSSNFEDFQRETCEVESIQKEKPPFKSYDSDTFSAKFSPASNNLGTEDEGRFSYEETDSDDEVEDNPNSVMMARAIVRSAEDSLSEGEVFELINSSSPALPNPVAMDPFRPAEKDASGDENNPKPLVLTGNKMLSPTSTPLSMSIPVVEKFYPRPKTASSSNFSPRRGNNLPDFRTFFRTSSVGKLSSSKSQDDLVESTTDVTSEPDLAEPPSFARNAWINTDALDLSLSNLDNLSHPGYSDRSSFSRRQERRHSSNIDFRSISSAVASAQRKQQQISSKIKSPWKLHATRARESVTSLLSFATSKSKDKKKQRPGLKDKKDMTVYRSEPEIGSSGSGNTSKLSDHSIASEALLSKEKELLVLDSNTKSKSFSNPELESPDSTADKPFTSGTDSYGCVTIGGHVTSPDTSSIPGPSLWLTKERAYSCGDVPDDSRCGRVGLEVCEGQASSKNLEDNVTFVELSETSERPTIVRSSNEEDKWTALCGESQDVTDDNGLSQLQNIKGSISGCDSKGSLTSEILGFVSPGKTNIVTDQNNCHHVSGMYLSQSEASALLSEDLCSEDISEDGALENNTSSTTSTGCNKEPERSGCNTEPEVHQPTVDQPHSVSDDESQDIEKEKDTSLPWMSPNLRRTLKAVRSHLQKTQSLERSPERLTSVFARHENITKSTEHNADESKSTGDGRIDGLGNNNQDSQRQQPVTDSECDNFSVLEAQANVGLQEETNVHKDWSQVSDISVEGFQGENTVPQPLTEYNSVDQKLLSDGSTQITENNGSCSVQSNICSQDGPVCLQQPQSPSVNDNDLIQTSDIIYREESANEREITTEWPQSPEPSGSSTQIEEFTQSVPHGKAILTDHPNLGLHQTSVFIVCSEDEFVNRDGGEDGKNSGKKFKQLKEYSKETFKTDRERELSREGKDHKGIWMLQKHKSVPALNIATEDTDFNVKYHEYFGLEVGNLEMDKVSHTIHQSDNEEYVNKSEGILYSNRNDFGASNIPFLKDDNSDSEEPNQMISNTMNNFNKNGENSITDLDRNSCSSTETLHGSPRQHDEAKSQWEGILPEIEEKLLSVRKLHRSDSVSSISSGMSGISVTSTRSEAKGKRKASKRVDGLLSNQLFRKHLVRHAETLERKVLRMHKKGMRKALSNFDLSKAPSEEINHFLNIGDINNNNDSDSSVGDASCEATPQSGRGSPDPSPKGSCSLSRSVSMSDRLQSSRDTHWTPHDSTEAHNSAENNIVVNCVTHSTNTSGEISEPPLDLGFENRTGASINPNPSEGYPRPLRKAASLVGFNASPKDGEKQLMSSDGPDLVATVRRRFSDVGKVDQFSTRHERSSYYRMHIPSFQEFKKRQMGSPPLEELESHDAQKLNPENQSPNIYVINEDETDDNLKAVGTNDNSKDTLPFTEAKSLSEEIGDLERREITVREIHSSDSNISPRSVPVFIHPAITITAGDVSKFTSTSRRYQQLNRSKSESNIKRRRQANVMLLPPQTRDRAQTFSTRPNIRDLSQDNQSIRRTSSVVSSRTLGRDAACCDIDTPKSSQPGYGMLSRKIKGHDSSVDSELFDDTAPQDFHRSVFCQNPVVIVSDGEISHKHDMSTMEFGSSNLLHFKKQKSLNAPSKTNNKGKTSEISALCSEVNLSKKQIPPSDTGNLSGHEGCHAIDSNSLHADSPHSQGALDLAGSLGFDLDDSLQEFTAVENIDLLSASNWPKSLSMSRVKERCNKTGVHEQSFESKSSSQSDWKQHTSVSSDDGQDADKTETRPSGVMFFLKNNDRDANPAEDIARANETSKSVRCREPGQNSVRGLRLSDADISCDEMLIDSKSLEGDCGRLANVTSLRTSPTNSSSDSDQSGKVSYSQT